MDHMSDSVFRYGAVNVVKLGYVASQRDDLLHLLARQECTQAV